LRKASVNTAAKGSSKNKATKIKAKPIKPRRTQAGSWLAWAVRVGWADGVM
jgi:hypothetical protein